MGLLALLVSQDWRVAGVIPLEALIYEIASEIDHTLETGLKACR